MAATVSEVAMILPVRDALVVPAEDVYAKAARRLLSSAGQTVSAEAALEFAAPDDEA
jgi:hypothetical protein